MNRNLLFFTSLIFIILLNTSCKYHKNEEENNIATLELNIKSLLGEGSFWNYKTSELYWIDIEGKKLHIYKPETQKDLVFNLPSRVGTVVPTTKKDEALVALEDGIYRINTQTGALSLFSDVESKLTINRFNDGKCDPNGNLWVGSMNLKQDVASAHLYKIGSDGKATAMLDSITISNGIVWTKDHKTMYYTDTPTGKIMAYDYNPETATISNARIAVKVPESLGFPDGMCIDENDKLWVALWNGNAVGNFDPVSGKLIRKIEVPAHNITSCSFGGKDLNILYITTASIDMTQEEKERFPEAGSVFKVIPGVKGVKNSIFKE